MNSIICNLRKGYVRVIVGYKNRSNLFFHLMIFKYITQYYVTQKYRLVINLRIKLRLLTQTKNKLLISWSVIYVGLPRLSTYTFN